MSTELPLRVQVAEALGWTELTIENEKWIGREPWGKLRMAVPSYDHSWCSAGPMVERFQIQLTSDGPKCWFASQYADEILGERSKGLGIGGTPCEAIARLVVQLAKEGKLPK
jgi:hypothetical protein